MTKFKIFIKLKKMLIVYDYKKDTTLNADHNYSTLKKEETIFYKR
jgi:hypothetical protein